MRSRANVRHVVAAAACLALIFGGRHSALAACQISSTFADLRQEVGADIVGECQGDEQLTDNGDRRQVTSRGEFVWRHGDRQVVFTNGYETWLHGPDGLVKRLNADRFAWESDPIVTPATNAIVPPPGPSPVVTGPATATPTSPAPAAATPASVSAALPRVATALAALAVGRLPDIGGGLRLGGFSGLAALDTTGTTFMSITDRGPNRDAKVRGDKVASFLLPTFSPTIVKLRREANELHVEQTIPLRLARGTDPITQSSLISGLPNTKRDEPAYDADAKRSLGTDPNAVDTEGLAIDPRDGSFWICEEYGPSILHVAGDGTILARLVPIGLGLKGANYDVKEILPAALLERKPNRGFEGITISPDGTTVFAIMQSPLAIPNEKAGEMSRNVRLVAIDVKSTPRMSAMYVYRTEAFSAIDANEQDDVKIGDLAAVSSTRLLVTERDSGSSASYRTVYLVDIAGATDVAGMTSLRKPLEQMDDGEFAKAKIVPAAKQAVVDLAELGFDHELVEGLAIVDETTLAVVNDNNFDDRESSEMMLVRLPAPLR